MIDPDAAICGNDSDTRYLTQKMVFLQSEFVLTRFAERPYVIW